MCEYDDPTSGWTTDRRGFAGAGALGLLAACAPKQAGPDGAGLVERAVGVPAPGGTLDGVLIHPAQGTHPAVILWPDVAGIRPAKLAMGRRLAESGYAVFVGNPYYRSVAGQQFADLADWRAQMKTKPVGPWVQKNTPEAIMETANALVSWLDDQDAVDSRSAIGVQGYCMTGAWTIIMAHAVPGRIKAAASFHAGRLSGQGENSAMNLIAGLPSRTHALIAVARDDAEKRPEEVPAALAEAARSAAKVTVEVYQAGHGWAVIDSPNYDEAEAERAWANLLAMYAAAL